MCDYMNYTNKICHFVNVPHTVSMLNDKKGAVFLKVVSLSMFAQKYLCKCKGTYFILQNRYLCIYTKKVFEQRY